MSPRFGGIPRAAWSWIALVLVWDAVPGASHYKIYHDDAFSSNCNIRFGSASYCDKLASSLAGTRSRSLDHINQRNPEGYGDA